MNELTIKKILKNYSLSLTLAILFLLSWVGQMIFQWQEFVQTEQIHGQQPTVSDFVPEFLSATFENWQSEFLQLFAMVIFTSFLVHKGSPESKDSDEKLEQKIDFLSKKIDMLTKKAKS